LRGFTLVEVLVALVLASLMALLSWRALDGMGRAGEITTQHEQSLQRIEAGLAQWSTDLDAMVDTGNVPPLDFDGLRLRLTRQSTDPNAGIVVVAWSLQSAPQGRVLQRWVSPVATTKNGLQAAWAMAERWARTPLPEDAKQVVTLFAVSNWQVFYYRDNAWSNPQSSTGASVANAPAKLPDGVQLVLDLPAANDQTQSAALSGKLTRYWLSPTLGATR
jgi:general secretion pathway protein J